MTIQSIQIYFFQTDASARVMVSVMGGGFDGSLPVQTIDGQRVINVPVEIAAGEGQGSKKTLLKITLADSELNPVSGVGNG